MHRSLKSQQSMRRSRWLPMRGLATGQSGSAMIKALLFLFFFTTMMAGLLQAMNQRQKLQSIAGFSEHRDQIGRAIQRYLKDTNSLFYSATRHQDHVNTPGNQTLSFYNSFRNRPLPRCAFHKHPGGSKFINGAEAVWANNYWNAYKNRACGAFPHVCTGNCASRTWTGFALYTQVPDGSSGNLVERKITRAGQGYWENIAAPRIMSDGWVASRPGQGWTERGARCNGTGNQCAYYSYSWFRPLCKDEAGSQATCNRARFMQFAYQVVPNPNYHNQERRKLLSRSPSNQQLQQPENWTRITVSSFNRSIGCPVGSSMKGVNDTGEAVCVCDWESYPMITEERRNAARAQLQYDGLGQPKNCQAVYDNLVSVEAYACDGGNAYFVGFKIKADGQREAECKNFTQVFDCSPTMEIVSNQYGGNCGPGGRIKSVQVSECYLDGAGQVFCTDNRIQCCKRVQ